MKKKLEAAHHRWQRSILGISWKDKVTNEKVRQATALLKLEDIIRCRRLRWLGHLSRMDHHILPRQALIWESEGFRRRPGRTRQNWKDVVKKELRKMGISWDDVEEAAEDRMSWRNLVAQSVFDAGWTRNQEPGLLSGVNYSWLLKGLRLSRPRRNVNSAGSPRCATEKRQKAWRDGRASEWADRRARANRRRSPDCTANQFVITPRQLDDWPGSPAR